MLEMETCGELTVLQPGESASLKERWELHAGVSDPKCERDVDEIVLPRIRR
jgi:hypothetical protein